MKDKEYFIKHSRVILRVLFAFPAGWTTKREITKKTDLTWESVWYGVKWLYKNGFLDSKDFDKRTKIYKLSKKGINLIKIFQED